MNELYIYLLSSLWGSLDKIGDDAIDIYKVKHGTYWLEFAKIIRIVIICTLLFIPKNIWLYIYIFIYSFSYFTAIPDEYLSDSYATSSGIIFSMLSAFYIYINRKQFTIKEVALCYVIAFTTCMAFVPDGIVSIMTFWNVHIPKHISNILNEEVGQTKLLLRCFALGLTILIVCLIQLFIKNNDLRIASTAFALAWVCYYRVSVFNQTYNLFFNENYTTERESENRILKEKQVYKYDIKNMIYSFIQQKKL